VAREIMKNKFAVNMPILIALTFMLFGCSSLAHQTKPTVMPDFNNKFFLADIPCSAPCWQGLTIGVSTENEVMATLSTLEFVKSNQLRVKEELVSDFNPENWVEGKDITVDCMNNRREPCLHLVIANDKLRNIDIELDDGLKLAEVINSFGEPDYVRGSYIGGDVIDCRIEFIWVEQQLNAYSTIFNQSEDVKHCYNIDKGGILSDELVISEVHYLPIEYINSRLSRLIFIEYKATH
jgi:hypothetical protein